MQVCLRKHKKQDRAACPNKYTRTQHTEQEHTKRQKTNTTKQDRRTPCFLLSELYLINALTCVPVQEGLAAEHGVEILSNPLEHLIGYDVAQNPLDKVVVRNPFDNVV